MNLYEKIGSIHMSAITRCLKSDLNLTYRRLERRPALAATQEAVRKYFGKRLSLTETGRQGGCINFYS